MGKIDYHLFLKSIETFNNDTEVEKLIRANTTVKHVSEGTILFQKGSKIDTIYVIQKGKVKLSGKNQSGKTIDFEIFQEKDIFPLGNYFHHSYHIIQAEAIAPTTLLCIPLQIYVTLLNAYPSLVVSNIQLLKNSIKNYYKMI